MEITSEANRRDTLPCRICGNATPMRGTKLCDRCWELERRVLADPELARKIMSTLDRQLNTCP